MISRLGEGSFGVVWLGESDSTVVKTLVALKVPMGDFNVDDVKKEAELWRSASGHPNVIPLVYAAEHDDQIVLGSEYAPEGSLKDWLDRRGTRVVPVDSAVEMTRGILTGLAHLHGRNIVHRDLKPSNVLIQGGLPRLTDFGLSRVLTSSYNSMRVMGTPAYMAPESFEGERKFETDLWAVGVMLHELLAGRLPFLPTNIAALIHAIRNVDPEPLADDVPERLRRVVARALSKDPKQRHASADEMIRELRDYDRIVEPVFVDPPTKPVPPRPVRAGFDLSGSLPAQVWEGAAFGAAGLGAFGLLIGFGAGEGWLAEDSLAQWPTLASDPLLKHVEIASLGIGLIAAIGVGVALSYRTIRSVLDERKKRGVWSKVFNFSENFKEAGKVYLGVFVACIAAFACVFAVKLLSLLVAFPASFWLSHPVSSRWGAVGIPLFLIRVDLSGATKGAAWTPSMQAIRMP